MQQAPNTCATHCPYCALQCGMNLVSADGRGLKVAPRDFPVNRGGLCQKGWSATELLDNPERLQTPLLRDAKGGPLRPGSWDEALDRIASEIRNAQVRFGPDAVGVFGGGSLTNEKAYLLGKFARVALRTSHIDYNGRFCMSSAAAASIKALGLDRGLPFPLEDIPRAETILLIGCNVAETMPPIMQYFEAQRRNGGSLIVVDPRKTPTAEAANLHLQITPGTDAALANGLLHIAIQQGHLDQEFISSRTSGFEQVRHIASSYWPGRVERITGIPESQLLTAARLLGTAKSAMILTARGPEQQSHGVENVLAFINLALALGKAGARTVAMVASPAKAMAKAAASTDRNPISCRAIAGSIIRSTARTSPESGAFANRIFPARDARLMKCSTGLGLRAVCGRCWFLVPTWRSPRRARVTSRSGSTRSTFWSSPTSFSPRPPSAPMWCFRPRNGRKKKAR